MLKVCSRCRESKGFSEFNKSADRPYGLSSYCKLCAKEYASLMYSRNNTRKRITQHNYVDLDELELSVLKRLKSLCTAAKGRKWDVEITFEYLVGIWDSQKGLCAYSELPLTYEANQFNTISLDRIDSKIGYIKGNVQLVCSMVNRMKQEFAETEFLAMCRIITETNKKKTSHVNSPRLDNDHAIELASLS